MNAQLRVKLRINAHQFLGSQNADPTFHDQQVENDDKQYQSRVFPGLARDSFMPRNLLQRNR